MKRCFVIAIILLVNTTSHTMDLARTPTKENAAFIKSVQQLVYSSSPVATTVPPPYAPYSFKKGPFTFYLHGYVKQDTFWDSRKVIPETGQTHLLLFPDKPIFNECGKDVNKKGSFNMLAVQSRLRTEIFGPDAFNTKAYGVIEADFRGSDTIGIVNTCRLVHAYAYLDWPDKSLLIGQYYHPVFPVEYNCYAQTVSYDTGVPVDTYALAPQIRLTKRSDSMAIALTLASFIYRPYGGPGKPGRPPFPGYHYARNAVMPEINLLAVAKIKKHRLGFSFDVIRLVPRFLTNEIIKTRESLFSFLAMVFLVLDWENKVTLKFKGMWGQNTVGFLSLGGYAVKEVNPYSDKREYVNLQTVSTWMDVTVTNYKTIEPGFFIGMVKNLGAGSRIISPVSPFDPGIYTIGTIEQPFAFAEIDYVLRFSPRLFWYRRPFMLGLELEFTRATWGNINEYGNVIDTMPANNFRFLIGTYYFF